MRRPVKPFSVEVRRAGRRVPQSFIPAREIEEAPQPDYSTPPVEAPPSSPPAPSAEPAPPRRVLQDLNEPRHDPLAARLQELEIAARPPRPPAGLEEQDAAHPRQRRSQRVFRHARGANAYCACCRSVQAPGARAAVQLGEEGTAAR